MLQLWYHRKRYCKAIDISKTQGSMGTWIRNRECKQTDIRQCEYVLNVRCSRKIRDGGKGNQEGIKFYLASYSGIHD